MVNKSWKKLVIFTGVCLLIAGCATTSKAPLLPPESTAGIYHRVSKNQTLWRICNAYKVNIEDVARINRLSDTSRIYVGQLIFIPGMTTPVEDLTLQADFNDKEGDFVWPVKGKVCSFFGMKRDGVKNKGICIQTKESAVVRSSRSGRVVFCSEGLKGYGKTIIIDHLDGYSTVYAQNFQNLVKLNQMVRRNQDIARVDSGKGDSVAELYFEIRKGYDALNPFFYLP